MEFTLKTRIKASPAQIYRAWLDSDLHSKMTGGNAVCSEKLGASFTAWNEYIEGVNIALIPNKNIIQSWRTTEFSNNDEDSQIEVSLEEINGETELTITHTNLPDNGEQYKKGWEEHYFAPMKIYFG